MQTSSLYNIRNKKGQLSTQPNTAALFQRTSVNTATSLKMYEKEYQIFEIHAPLCRE